MHCASAHEEAINCPDYEQTTHAAKSARYSASNSHSPGINFFARSSLVRSVTLLIAIISYKFASGGREKLASK